MGLKEQAANNIASEAFPQSWMQQPAKARATAGRALAISHTLNAAFAAACALALAGDQAKAEALGNEIISRRPSDVFVNSVGIPLVRALGELNRKNPARAVEILNASTAYDKVILNLLVTRGEAYLQLGKGREAQGEFQTVLERRNANPTDPMISFAKL